MDCADAIAVLAVLSVQTIWTDGAGRRVLSEVDDLWVEVRPNVYVPRDDVGAFDRQREAPGVCRAFRTLDLLGDADPLPDARLWCLHWTGTDAGQPRLVCKSP